MRVEIINTGTELLLGQVTNTHLGYLAQGLFGLGLRVGRQVTVPDGPAITAALREAMARADLILVTGGLGPTSDDITREAAAEAFGKKLIFHQEILDGITAKFTSRNIAGLKYSHAPARPPPTTYSRRSSVFTSPANAIPSAIPTVLKILSASLSPCAAS